MWSIKANNEISIVISGAAGQGIQTIEELVLDIMNSEGYNVFAYSEVMSRIRGGNNSTEIRISSERVSSFVDRIDVFIPLENDALNRFIKRITSDTLIICQPGMIAGSIVKNNYNIVDLPFEDAAIGLGGKIFINIIIFGIICALMEINIEPVLAITRKRYANLDEDKLQKNIMAIEKGYELFHDNLSLLIKNPALKKSNIPKDEPTLFGSACIALGALAGGCNFVSSYPMSPSTDVFVYMARHSLDYNIVVEQAEDEISAINMAIGAWYAGARAMVTTSGGGFALMVEALSLCGCVESPLVVHLGQRPGPATGLPTRTEQADLLFALFSGHGEFPRVILAPANKKDGITLTCHAFNIADKYQVPVIILTDQYFLDSANNVCDLNADELKEEKFIIRTNADYKRYLVTDSGISPRGIPGYGDGIVCCDSDEHDEKGYITEDFETRTKMVNKRLKKTESLYADMLSPKFMGNDTYTYLLVGWGSTYETIREALKHLNNDGISFLHFNQVYPLSKDTLIYLEKAEEVIIIENNATSQFGKIIKLETGFECHHSILKYDGMPFSVEEIMLRITELIQ